MCVCVLCQSLHCKHIPLFLQCLHLLCFLLCTHVCVGYVSGVLCQSLHGEHIPLFLQCLTQTLNLNPTPYTQTLTSCELTFILATFPARLHPLSFTQIASVRPSVWHPRLSDRTRSTCNAHMCAMSFSTPMAGETGGWAKRTVASTPTAGEFGGRAKGQEAPTPTANSGACRCCSSGGVTAAQATAAAMMEMMNTGM